MSSLLSLFKKFPTEESCIKHLEKIRWGDKPVCPYCQSQKISQHNKLQLIDRDKTRVISPQF